MVVTQAARSIPRQSYSFVESPGLRRDIINYQEDLLHSIQECAC